MKKEARTLIEYGESLGFEYAGVNGRGHYILRHKNGETTISATPGAWSQSANARAEMRRIAGVRSDSPKAGRYHHTKNAGFSMSAALAERTQFARFTAVCDEREGERRDDQLRSQLADELKEHLAYIRSFQLGIRRHGPTPGIEALLEDRLERFDRAMFALERLEA